MERKNNQNEDFQYPCSQTHLLFSHTSCKVSFRHHQYLLSVCGYRLLVYRLVKFLVDWYKLCCAGANSCPACKSPPLSCFFVVLWNSLSIGMHHSQVVLCWSKSLFCCKYPPPDCFFIILWNSLPVGINQSQGVLCLGNSICC